MKEDQKQAIGSPATEPNPQAEVGKKDKFSTLTQFKSKKGRVRFITRCAMFSSLATIFYIWLKFPLPFLPSFLEVNFSNLFIIMGSLLTGPIGGVIIVAIRFLLKIIISPTTTGFVGELSDLLMGLTVALSSGIIYSIKHDKVGGIMSIAAAYLSIMFFGVFFNWTIIMPMYINLYGAGAVAGMMKSTLPNINEENLMAVYLFGGCLPFNAIAGGANSLLALLVYKKTSTILKRIGI